MVHEHNQGREAKLEAYYDNLCNAFIKIAGYVDHSFSSQCSGMQTHILASVPSFLSFFLLLLPAFFFFLPRVRCLKHICCVAGKRTRSTIASLIESFVFRVLYLRGLRAKLQPLEVDCACGVLWFSFAFFRIFSRASFACLPPSLPSPSTSLAFFFSVAASLLPPLFLTSFSHPFIPSWPPFCATSSFLISFLHCLILFSLLFILSDGQEWVRARC